MYACVVCRDLVHVYIYIYIITLLRVYTVPVVELAVSQSQMCKRCF